jgi:glutaredoxin
VEYRNVLQDSASLSEMLRLVGGRRDVPVVLENGRATVGYGGS